uniref:SIVA1 apoptosis inducing factor n=1 Tax=Coturnix japonica TaxID=93934 RepID=A0A8C2SUN6_COTJA
MPKRSCPFGDAAPLQLKTRVGLKELSRGVRGDEYRREIYERTRRLLFRAAQSCTEPAWPAAPRAASRSTEPESGGGSVGRSRSEQLRIGPNGKLLRCTANTEIPPVGVSKACSSCVRAADVKEACAQCDRFVCQSCSRVCSCCNAVTCSLYADVGEQILCNGCSIFQV